MSAIGSSPLGFRVAGTPEDDEVCALLADTMRSIGLEDVRLESVHARDKQSKLHLQALLDVESLDDALERENLGAAARAAARPGRNRLARHVGREVFRARRRPAPAGPSRLRLGGERTHYARPRRAVGRSAASPAPPARPLAGQLADAEARRSARELQRRLDRIADAVEQAASRLELR